MFHDRSNTQEHVLLVLRDETVLKKKGTSIRRGTHRLFLVLEAGPGVPGRQENSESSGEFRIDTGWDGDGLTRLPAKHYPTKNILNLYIHLYIYLSFFLYFVMRSKMFESFRVCCLNYILVA